MRCKFSHLNHRRITGFAGVRPAQRVPSRSSLVRGVDASAVSVRLVRTGVRWTCGLTSSWAATTEARLSGGVVDKSAISKTRSTMQFREWLNLNGKEANVTMSVSVRG